MSETIFLKLGGSLITEKDRPNTALISQIDEIALQVKEFITMHPDTRLLLGHGSGSFGHVAASRYHTRDGVQSTEQWQGFTQVWYAARLLNQIVLERFTTVGLPVISFPLSAAAVTNNHKVKEWNTLPILSALEHHLLPVVYGDVVLDEYLGGTILSTEEQFAHLTSLLYPDRILLAGLEPGVWQDFPACTSLISVITPKTYPHIASSIFGSASVDVTGGMSAKVQDMLCLIENDPHLCVQIFSGKGSKTVLAALSDEKVGTQLRADS
jgi:isopentenyl phosphate kinase